LKRDKKRARELWLMANGQQMLLVSANGVTRLELDQATLPDDSPHLERVLPELADALAQDESAGTLTRVHLHSSLPAHWQNFPWERLTLGGRNLFGQAVFFRHASLGQPKDKFCGNLLHVHSLWPDFGQVADILRPSIADGQMRLRPSGLDTSLLSHDWRDVWALAIVAHGSDDLAIPAVDASGEPWAFPAMSHWPQVVFLLACGADSSLIRHAQAMLDAGAHTVIVGEGTLDLRPSLLGLSSLAKSRADGIDLINALVKLQERDKSRGGVRQWVVCGCPPGGAAHGQLDQWTLQSLLAHGDLSAAPELWRDYHDIDPGAHGEGDLLDELKHTPCWPITSSWTLPQAMALAEIYDPAAQPGFARQYASLADSLKESTPHQSLLSLAISLRRQGKTLAAFHALFEAMEEAQDAFRSGQLDAETRLRYYFTLFDLLLDLHLPGAAAPVHDRIRAELASATNLDLCVLEHHWLDRESLWYWRSGQPDMAYAIQQRKREQALAMQANGGAEDGYRELARLLWMAAWQRYPEAEKLLAEAESILGEEQLATLDKPGNDDYKYLLRSSLLARWRMGFQGHVPDSVRGKLEESLNSASIDPGVNATSVIIASLMESSDDWSADLALHRLEDSGYWLEAAYWSGQRFDRDKASKYAEQLLDIRRKVNFLLSPRIELVAEWIHPVGDWLSDINQESETRCRREQAQLIEPYLLSGMGSIGL
jgi:hypothetical protein